MQELESGGSLDVGELINRLDSAYSNGELSAADRILEFPRLLKALKKVYTQDLMEDRARHARVYGLLEDLLELLVSYKANLVDENAPSLYRPRSQSRFTIIVDQLKVELRKHRRNDNAQD